MKDFLPIGNVRRLLFDDCWTYSVPNCSIS